MLGLAPRKAITHFVLVVIEAQQRLQALLQT